MSTFTGVFDTNGKPICIGDFAESEWGYSLLVCADEAGEPYGKLVCEPGHSCEYIPYSLSGKLLLKELK